MKFYERVEELLEKYDTTWYRLAHDTDIPESTIYSYRSGTRKPSPENLIKIADYFGMTIDRLLQNVDIRRSA